ncbi:hypothetical protein NBRC110019_23600 [Neptunitalea chrysea]|uniref:Calx-beta domain-containing protein n=1 Tax=Neptunitalea chrysea TaxID=1647581 RepID=A0A9W6B622_9FLAO|nr:hypothetical protein [Neptunitalea chrysea]GLB53319.1 hypothetical protein NBRC110019_23600 [Neptunitalea chrysea]
MKKYIYKIFSLLVITGGIITSCDYRKADQDVASTISPDNPTASFAVSTTSINEEGNPEITVNITLDKAIHEDLNFDIVSTDGTAEEGVDYDITDEGTVDAYQTTGTATIIIYHDILPEDTETFSIAIGATSTPYAYMVGGSDTFDLSIENYTNDDLLIELNWDGTYTDASGADQDLCDIDFDMILYDDTFATIATAYYDCPEALDLAGYADGTYYLQAGLYSLGSATFQSETYFPAKFILTKTGQSIDEIDLSTYWNSTNGGEEEGYADAYNYYVLTISSGSYTLQDFFTGDPVWSGKTKSELAEIFHAPKKF